MAEDVDPIVLEAVPYDVDHALADPPGQRAIAEAVARGEGGDSALEERAGVVEADPHAVDLELVQRADHVVERRARRRAKRRRDADVVFEADAQSQARRVVDVAQHVVVVPQLLAPGKMVRHAVRAHRDGARALFERDRAVGALGVDVVVEQPQGQGSG